MSKKFLKKMLIEVQRELEQPANTSKGIDGFRQTSANLKEHKLRASVSGVKNEVMRELLSPTYNIDPRILNDERFRKSLDKYTKALVNSTYLKAKAKYGASVNTRVVGNKSAWSITVLETEKLEKTNWDTAEDVFNAVKNLYYAPLNTLVDNLNQVIKTIDLDAFENSQNLSQIQKGRFLDLGHRSGFAVVDQQVGRASSQVKNRIESYNRKNKEKITEKDIRNLGLNFFVKKRATEEKEVIEVGFESEYYNRLYGRTTEADFKRDALKRVREAIIKVDRATSLLERPGSDSRVEVEKKKVIKSFDTKTTRRKNVKVKSKDFKTKITKSAEVVKKVNKKVKKVKPKDLSIGQIKGIKTPGPKKSSANSNVSLAALINAKLPATVRENMGEPALVNRTGRFANSVRVMEVTKTQQGYPSIGYTYQKNPYQVFEDGAGVPPWANGKRDPRQLIDRSIREIAAELLTGRFYTRRI